MNIRELGLKQVMHCRQRYKKKSSDEAKEPILSVKWMLPEFKPIYIVLLHRKQSKGKEHG